MVSAPALSQQSEWVDSGLYEVYEAQPGCLAGSSSDPSVFFVCGDSDLLRSTTGGVSWHPVLHEKIRRIVVSASHPDRVYAVAGGYRIYRSEDGGTTWSERTLGYAYINVLVVHPTNPDLVYIGSGISSDGGATLRGVYRSEDGGDSWVGVSDGEVLRVFAVLLDTTDPDTVYAGVMPRDWEEMLFWRSADGGLSWDYLFPTASHVGLAALAMTPAGYATPAIYGLTVNRDLFKTVDAGQTWTLLDTPVLRGGIWVDPSDPEVVYSLGEGAFFRSLDGGATWSGREVRFDGDRVCNPWSTYMEPATGHMTILCENESVVLRSEDRAESWYLVGQVAHSPTPVRDLAVNPDEPHRLYATLDGTVSGLSVSDDGGATWSLLDGSPEDLGPVAVDPTDPQTVWVGAPNVEDRSSLRLNKSEDSGATWWPYVIGDPRTRQELTAFVIHPESNGYFLAGSRTVGSPANYSDLWRSTDGPRNWDRIGGAGTALALDPNDPNTLYHIRDKPGQVFETTSIWENESTREITPEEGIGEIRDIAVDMESTVYVAASDGLWRWNGDTWKLQTGLQSSNFTALTVDDAVTPGIVYAAGEDPVGLYYSDDRGDAWTDISEGTYLPSVRKLLVSDGYLFAVPSNGGVWRRKAVPTGVSTEDPHELPDAFTLSQNYPNPFNPSTTIRFSVPSFSWVTLTVHDVLGRRVDTLVDRALPAGAHEVAFKSGHLASGPYLYRLETPTGTISRVMVVLR